MKEEWKYIYILDEKTEYLVSSKGRVFSKYSNKILKPDISNCGYLRVDIYKNKKHKKISVHRLVAIAFINNPNNLPEVNHKDGDKTNNSVENLEWVTSSENDYHAYLTGIKSAKHGDESHLAKYKRKDVIKACELMESGEYTLPEISLLTGINIGMLYCIHDRKSWTNVSILYDVQNCKSVKNEYSDVQIELVYALLEEDKLSIYDISDKTNVKTSTIYNILTNRDTKFRHLREIYNISNYHRNKILPKLPDEVVDVIKQYLKDGFTPKEISKIVHEKYHINTDRIRHFSTRLKHKISSTTRES